MVENEAHKKMRKWEGGLKRKVWTSFPFVRKVKKPLSYSERNRN